MRSRTACVIAALVLSACSQAATPTPTSGPTTGASSEASAEPTLDPELQAFIDAGKMVVGHGINNVPFAYVDENGVHEGIDPDLVRECSSRIGLPEPEFLEVEFSALISSVQAGRIDFAASGMLYRVDRAEAAIASVPLYTTREILVVQGGNPLDIHEHDDLKNVEGNVGYVLGSTPATQYQNDFGSRAVGYDSETSAFADLDADRIIAVPYNELVTIQYMEANPAADIEIADPFPPYYETATAWYFRDIPSLAEAVSDCLRDLKEDGTFAEILEANDYPVEAIAPNDAEPEPAPES